MRSFRSACAVAAAVSLLGCGKGSAATAPLVVDQYSVAGSWSGCVTEPAAQCVLVSMSLRDSVTTDSTATVAGTGNWEDNVDLKGALSGARLTLNGNATNIVQGWSFIGVLSGSQLTGTMTFPGTASAYPAVFNRSQ
jgi:hypothetical protein